MLVYPMHDNNQRKIFIAYSGDKEEILIGKSDKECKRYSLEKHNYEIFDKSWGKWVHLRLRQDVRDLSEEKTRSRDAQIFLDEVIKFAKENSEKLTSADVDLWAINRDRTLVKMISGDPGTIALFEKNGFIDQKTIKEIVAEWDINRTYFSLEKFVSGMESLKILLRGKKVWSVSDKKGNWYLKAY